MAVSEQVWELETRKGWTGALWSSRPRTPSYFGVYCVHSPAERVSPEIASDFEAEVLRYLGPVIARSRVTFLGTGGTEVVVSDGAITRRLRYAFVGRRLIGAIAPEDSYWPRSDERFFAKLTLFPLAKPSSR
jgi:hypothetical protein